jgi:DNA-binding transcriptional ArsR family regulator
MTPSPGPSPSTFGFPRPEPSWEGPSRPSKYLRALKDAGLVEARTDAQRRLYRIRPDPLAELDDWLSTYRQLWTAHLDRLEDHLDRRRKP